MHQLEVQLVVLTHHRGMDRVNLDDVVGISDAVLWRERVGRHVVDEGH